MRSYKGTPSRFSRFSILGNGNPILPRFLDEARTTEVKAVRGHAIVVLAVTSPCSGVAYDLRIAKAT